MNETDAALAPAPGNPLAMASVVAAVLGVVVYCCGNFVCLGWMAFFVWFVGAIAGGVALSQSAQGSGRTMAMVGLGLNLFFGIGAVLLVFLGFGIGMLSGAMDAANQL